MHPAEGRMIIEAAARCAATARFCTIRVLIHSGIVNEWRRPVGETSTMLET